MEADMNHLNILALTDIHYIGVADHTSKIAKRKTREALELLQKVFHSVDKNHIDLVIVLGDLVDNGNAPGAEEDLMTLYSEFTRFGKPVIVVPGNHDANPQTVFQIFNDYEGLHMADGYQFITFAEEYAEDDSTERNRKKMDQVFHGTDPDLPVITLQHNPIYPHIVSSYPYNLKNADEVMGFYSSQEVVLSLSGHLHGGAGLNVKGNVGYFTCASLCEEPFCYTLITLKGKEYKMKVKNLLDQGESI
jgi:3',5'-cyclic AMP phosphodiesterase CpdA